MKKKIRSLLPESLKKRLRKIKVVYVNYFIKKKLSKKMRVKHQELIAEVKSKDKIKVVFLVIQHSAWKVDSVFKEMQNDPLFEPVILVCPFITYGEERMMDDLNKTYDFFKRKGYPVVSSLKNSEAPYDWLEMKELQPDLILFTNPHNLTRPEYYSDAYMNYLTCYIPYHHEVGLYGGNEEQYNQDIHNAFWMIFVPHQCSKDTYKKYCASKDRNVLVTGYPACEELYSKRTEKVWKPQESKKMKIIWAPHHTIENKVLPYSNFLEYADLFIELIKNNKDNVQWAFKPHPILKSNLYLHPKWGKKRTDLYYQLWAESSNTQLEEGGYTELFQQSDAMIHDSGSFLAEYIYLKKPVLYTVRTKNYKSYYNDFGLSALASIKVAENESDIINFVDRLLSNEEKITSEHHRFIESNIAPFFGETTPSKVIINLIKSKLQHNER